MKHEHKSHRNTAIQLIVRNKQYKNNIKGAKI